MKNLLIKFFSKTFFYLKNVAQIYKYNQYRIQYSINKSFIFNGEGILFYGDGEISIDENSYLGRFGTIQSSGASKVIIGKNCKIGPFFSIWTNSSEVDCDYNFENLIIPKIGDIVIGNAVWIGANVVITPGVKIGENSIIGANSVVTKDVQNGAIVGGVPAKFIRFKNIPEFIND